MLRIHPETVCFLAFAAALTRLTSSALKRRATIFPLASPLGSFGRQTFLGLGWAGIAELLNDECSYGGGWGQRRMNVKHGNRI